MNHHQLNARHRALIGFVRLNPDSTAREIALYFENHEQEALQATDNATRCAIRRLCEKGFLEFHSTKNTRQHPRYRVTPLGQTVA